MFDVSKPPTDKSCLICNTPLTEETRPGGKYHMVQGNRIWLCARDADAFSIGRSIGTTEINNRILHTVANLTDEATGWALKEQVLELLPPARRQELMQERLASLVERTPREIYADMQKTVIGQGEAKRRVSLAVYEHVRAIARGTTETIVEPNNILLIGPSGSGKTLIAHTIARTLGLPAVSVDATSFSPSGFQGKDADSMINDLYQKANSNDILAERGCCYIDEMDKLAAHTRQDNGRMEVLNSSTQSTLLRLIEGKDVYVGPSPGTPLNQTTEQAIVNTSRILFFGGGAFEGLGEIVAELSGFKRRRISIRNGPQDADLAFENAIRNHEVLASAPAEVLVEALIQYGLLAELVGRMPIIVPLAPLTEVELRQVLLETTHSPILRAEKLFAESEYKLEFTEEAITKIVSMAFKMETGARALHYIVKKSVSMAGYQYLDTLKNTESTSMHKSRGAIIIGVDTIGDPSSFEFKRIKKRTSRVKPFAG